MIEHMLHVRALQAAARWVDEEAAAPSPQVEPRPTDPPAPPRAGVDAQQPRLIPYRVTD